MDVLEVVYKERERAQALQHQRELDAAEANRQLLRLCAEFDAPVRARLAGFAERQFIHEPRPRMLLRARVITSYWEELPEPKYTLVHRYILWGASLSTMRQRFKTDARHSPYWVLMHATAGARIRVSVSGRHDESIPVELFSDAWLAAQLDRAPVMRFASLREDSRALALPM